ncbi:MAG: penicillin-binding protein activator, partial [Pseudomonadota bacterium]
MTYARLSRPARRLAGPARLILVAAMALALSGCPSGGATRGTSPELATATRHQQQGRHADAAAAFERLAARERGDARDALLLDATRAWLEAGQLTRALGALDNVTNVPPDDKAVGLLTGYRALRDGNAEAAVNLLDSLRPSLPGRYLGLWYDLRGRAFFQTGDVTRGVASLVERELWLDRGEDIDANRDVIWRALQTVGQKGATFDIPEGTDAVTAGWLALASADASGALNPLGKFAALRDWREAHPGHPGVRIVEQMTESAPMSFSYPDTIAVLLPLSGRFAGTAAAVRDGVMAAYLADDAQIGRPALRFYDTGSEDAVSLLQRASLDGARLAIGPLLKSQVDAVAAAAPSLPVLALNTTGDEAPYAPSVFQFSLAPEHEAATVAERAVAEGYSRAVALVPNSAWGERLLNAFNDRLTS